jgi:hypothetical protein
MKLSKAIVVLGLVLASVTPLLVAQEGRWSSSRASASVPLDSWVYPLFDRLGAMGYLPSELAGERPWTRTECARLVREIAERLEADPDSQVKTVYNALAAEFEPELGGAKSTAVLESAYADVTGIGGTPLTDGFHFGETITNDFGRPYQEGANLATGASARATLGPLGVYIRGEYQHAPSALAPSSQVLSAESAVDGLPVAPGHAISATDRLRLLDSYVALNLNDWQATFGKQSLWWGPAQGGDLLLSNNAEPITMLRLARATPFRLPGFLAPILGDIRTDSFLGQVQGDNFVRLGPTFVLTGTYDHTFNPQPYMWGQKLSLKPTPNFEVGVGITSIFAGMGRPLTFGTFFHTFSMHGNNQAVDPGKRASEFDFSYRIPKIRDWLTFYAQGMAWDEPNPIAYPRRSAMNTGIYLPKLPKLPKLDFRMEGVYTDVPAYPNADYYTNVHYANGYTNYGQILGDWIGRDGVGLQLWSTYWFSAERKLQFEYRNQIVDHTFLEGGHLDDVSARYDLRLKKNIAVTGCLQYERWRFPLLAQYPRRNATAEVEVQYVNLPLFRMR